jgi:hypothetical protein
VAFSFDQCGTAVGEERHRRNISPMGLGLLCLQLLPKPTASWIAHTTPEPCVYCLLFWNFLTLRHTTDAPTTGSLRQHQRSTKRTRASSTHNGRLRIQVPGANLGKEGNADSDSGSRKSRRLSISFGQRR